MAKIRGIKPDLWTDEDFVEVSAFARLLWVGMWNFACDNGHLADRSKQIKMRVLPTDEVNCADLLRELEAQGLIHRQAGWITVPNLTRHQKVDHRYFTTCEKPGCARPERETRRAPSGDTASTRRGHAWTPGDGDVKGSDGDGDGEVNVGDLMIPDLQIRDDVDRLCEHLANAIESNGSKRPSIGKRWHDAARLMIDNDGRTEEEIHRAIDWCQSDSFWRANVLSMPKLREKFDQMRLAAARTSGVRKQQDTDNLFDRAMERALSRMETP